MLIVGLLGFRLEGWFGSGGVGGVGAGGSSIGWLVGLLLRLFVGICFW